MPASPFVALPVLVSAIFVFTSAARCQSGDTDAPPPTSPETDFRITVGVSLSLSGVDYSYSLGLASDNGFQYDTWSVLQASPAMADQIGMDPSQQEAMQELYQKTIKDLTSRIPGAAVSDSRREEMEHQFHVLDRQLFNMLTPGQQTAFDQARTALEVKSVGFEKFITSSRTMSALGIDSQLSDRLAESFRDAGKKIELLQADILRDANQQLVNRLDTRQKQNLDRHLDDAAMSRILSAPLFAGTSAREFRTLKSSCLEDVLADDRSLHKKLGLSKSQTDQLLAAAKDGRGESGDRVDLKALLEPGQYSQLVALTARNEAGRYGTVAAFSGGCLATEAGLSEKEARDLFEAGCEIAETADRRIAEARGNQLRVALDPLPVQCREQILDSLSSSECASQAVLVR